MLKMMAIKEYAEHKSYITDVEFRTGEAVFTYVDCHSHTGESHVREMKRKFNMEVANVNFRDSEIHWQVAD